MRRSVAAAVAAAAIGAGGLLGGLVNAPLAGAAQTATGAVGWVHDALSGLVSDGTITQQQADAVQAALDEARPEGPAHGPGHLGGGPMHMASVAKALGMTDAELRTALQSGQTIAQIASSKGVDVQTVVDAIVAEHKARLDENVAAGDLTQEQADAMLAGASERAAAMVNGERPAFRGGPGPGMGEGPFGPPPNGAAPESGITTS